MRLWRPAVGLLLAINEERAEPPSLISFLSPPTPSSSSSPRCLATALMALIRRFFGAEKGKTPREEQGPLPPKKRLNRPHDAGEKPEVTRPWYERPPPGFPLPLYARAQGFGEGGSASRRASHDHDGQAEVAWAAGP